jgi:hypothetical protein
MTVRVLALASGQTTTEAHRLGITGLTQSAGVITGRSGIYPASGAANLATVSAMVASIAPFNAWIDGTNSSSQGGYNFCSDATVNITFDAGNASTVRTDRVIGRVKDNIYDGSGATTGEVAYWKGNGTTGVATALPANSLLLFEVAVPAGASAGGSGINFGTQTTDKRVYTSASGGITPIGNTTDRSAMVTPTEGTVIYRTDVDYLEITSDGTNWKPVGEQKFPNAATRDAAYTAVLGDKAFLTDVKRTTVNTGTKWVYGPGEIIARYRRTTNSSTTTSEVGVIRIDSVALKAGQSIRVRTSNLWLTSGTGDPVRCYVKYSTSGNATTSSTAMEGGSCGTTIGSTSYDETQRIDTIYIVPSDATYSFILTIARPAGSGSAGILASADKIIELSIEGLGIDPGSSGTSI